MTQPQAPHDTDTADARAMLGAGPKPTALEKAHHKPSCLSLVLRLERLPCNCGLDAARRQASAESRACNNTGLGVE